MKNPLENSNMYTQLYLWNAYNKFKWQNNYLLYYSKRWSCYLGHNSFQTLICYVNLHLPSIEIIIEPFS